MKHRSRRKLFFPVGLISLTLFPILGFQKLAELYIERKTHPNCIELNFTPSRGQFFNKEYSIKKIKKKRRYKTFYLTSDTTINREILNRARLLLNNIKKKKDVRNGVHFAFNNSTKYQDYIKAIDFCFEKFPSVFVLNNNDIWAMYVEIDTSNYPKKILDAYRRKRKL
ncbi:MAG: hypothetical protein A3F72_13115 [Bacteroidetes bacterium RIFCSPLOWO2_12_FULL_35_15]|nr:MAG: hypothetical protein A3F72_13115 [Bacteroidetes bacterium RIFCSPLOWO2_12_FULL_35_15]